MFASTSSQQKNISTRAFLLLKSASPGPQNSHFGAVKEHEISRLFFPYIHVTFIQKNPVPPSELINIKILPQIASQGKNSLSLKHMGSKLCLQGRTHFSFELRNCGKI